MQAAKHAVVLDEAEQAAILVEFDRKTQPPSFEKYLWIFKAFYWLAAVVAAASLIGYIAFRDVVPYDALIAAAVLVCMIALIGAVPPLFLRAMAASEAYGRAEAAVALCATTDLAGDARRSAAANMFAYTRVPRGVWSHNALDLAGAAADTSANMDYLLAVEELLARERGVVRVFGGIGTTGGQS